MVLVAKISSRRQCNTQTWSHKDINTSNSMLTHASSFTSLSVYWEALCFISADLALCDLSAGCVVTVEWMHLNVTNHYFLLLKLNFDACNQVCLSALLSKWITNQTFEKHSSLNWSWSQGVIVQRRKQAWFANILSLFLNSFMCMCVTDVWAAWAQGGSVTGTKTSTYASPVKMTWIKTCLRWVMCLIHQSDASRSSWY